MQPAGGYFTRGLGGEGLMRAHAFGTYYLITNFLLPSTPSTSSQLGAPAPDYISTWRFAVILDRASVLGEREGNHNCSPGMFSLQVQRGDSGPDLDLQGWRMPRSPEHNPRNLGMSCAHTRRMLNLVSSRSSVQSSQHPET